MNRDQYGFLYYDIGDVVTFRWEGTVYMGIIEESFEFNRTYGIWCSELPIQNHKILVSRTRIIDIPATMKPCIKSMLEL